MNENPQLENPQTDNTEDNNEDKWDFSDYAYTITGIIAGVLLVGPELLESLLNITILGGSLADRGEALAEGLTYGLAYTGFDFSLRALSPLFFLITTSIVYFKEAFDVKKTGEYKGSMFTHTFESLFEEALYFTVTTIMLFSAILFGAMYISWLAGPITWVLFIFIFPLFNRASESDETAKIPWQLLFVLIAGIAVEAYTGTWVAFPLSWLIICGANFIETVRKGDRSLDTIFNAIYYAISVIMMAVGIFLGNWLMSWAALIIALLICWVLSKFKNLRGARQ